jgi:hypothetical protein
MQRASSLVDFYARFAPAGGPANNQIWPTAATFATSSLNYDRCVISLTESQIERTRSPSVYCEAVQA